MAEVYRKEIVPKKKEEQHVNKEKNIGEIDRKKRQKRMMWSALLKRVFNINIEKCRQCGSIMKKMYPIFSGIVLNILLHKLKIADKPPIIHMSKSYNTIFDY